MHLCRGRSQQAREPEGAVCLCLWNVSRSSGMLCICLPACISMQWYVAAMPCITAWLTITPTPSLFNPAGGTHAELVLGLVPADEAKHPQDGAPAVPRLPAADWLRRGALAERLRRVTQARHAYRASVKLGFSLSGYMALLRLESEVGEVGDVLLCANMVAKWHQEEAARKGQVVGRHPVLAVLQALGQLLQRVPVNEVKTAAAAAHSNAWVLEVLNNWARTH